MKAVIITIKLGRSPATIRWQMYAPSAIKSSGTMLVLNNKNNKKNNNKNNLQ